MSMSRRAALAALAGATFLPHAAVAAPVIDRLARLVVGSAPGGGTDAIARLLAERLIGRYAPQVIVDNRPGASLRLAAEHVKNAAPDGASFFLSPMPVLALFPHTLPRTTRYHPLTDFTPVATVGELAYGLVVEASNPARDLSDFIARGRANGGVTFAPPVLGAPQHMLMVTFGREVALEIRVIPYRSAAQGLVDVIGGRIDCSMTHMAELSPQVRGGRVRLLAVSSERRLAGFPDVPTFAELGYPRYTATEAYCVVMPAGAPAELVAGLNGALARSVAEPDVHERLLRFEITPLVLSPSATAARLRAEYEAWGPIVRASGFTAEE